jgi:hypothetical protein
VRTTQAICQLRSVVNPKFLVFEQQATKEEYQSYPTKRWLNYQHESLTKHGDDPELSAGVREFMQPNANGQK